MQGTALLFRVLSAAPAQRNQFLFGLAWFCNIGVLGQVLGGVAQIFVFVDDGDLAEPVTHAPMHLVVDQALNALLRSLAVFGDRSPERQKTADEPTAVGTIE